MSRAARHLRLPVVIAYTVLGTAWAGFARGLVPPAIAAAYQGRSLPLLNRVLQGRSHHPVEHYLALWGAFSGAVLLALVLHLTLVLIWRGREGHRAAGNRLDRAMVFLGISAAFLALTVLSGPRHDYVADLEIWDVVLRGGDPWWLLPSRNYPLNAYGPLFNVLAVPGYANPLAPKLLFAYAFLLALTWLDREGGRCRAAGDPPVVGMFAWFLNPYPWIEIAYYGHFDVLVGLACVAAVHDRIRGRDVRSGVWLALGVLLKYLPIVILPSLVLDGRRIRWRLLVPSLLTIVLGLSASFLAWGPSTFRPLTFAASRGSNLMSVFRFLRGGYSPLRLIRDAPNVDRLAVPCLAAAGLAVFAWSAYRRLAPALSAVLAVLTTLLFYQVGFTQYLMIIAMLIAYWMLRDGGRVRSDRLLAAALAAYFGWIVAFELIACWIGMAIVDPKGPWVWVDELAGLPTFMTGSLLLACLARSSARDAGARSSSPPPSDHGADAR